MTLAASAAVAAIALVVVASANSALAASSLVNGNFETGDLTPEEDWTVDPTNSGDASVVSSYAVEDPSQNCEWQTACVPRYLSATPHEGSYFALLTPGGQSDKTAISQPFTASNGDKVSGWVFTGKTLFHERGFETYDDDTGQVVLKDSEGEETLFEDSGSSAVDYGSSVWKYWEYTFTDLPGEGEFQIEANQSNLDRTIFWEPSVLGLDDVKLSTLAPDNTKPSTSATRSVEPTAAGWNNKDVTVKLKATDNEGGWGLKELTYRINGGEPETKQGEQSNLPIDVEVPAITAEGETTITYYATDKAGNVEDEQSLKVNIDKTPPQVDTKSISPANTATRVSPTDPKISVAFIESGSGIRLSTLSPNGFAVYKATRFSGTERVSGTVSYNAASKTATFTPSQKLGKGTYSAFINPSYVKDRADNALANDYTWSFSVG
jgi:hypothetical protein